MIIRKLFRFEGSHIVRDCSSSKCARSIHGHSYVVELFLRSSTLDNAGMVMDFGLLKPYKDLIDMFDHTHLLWYVDDDEYRDAIKKVNERWLELDCNPSAENLAYLFHWLIQRHLKQTRFQNGEEGVTVKSVRVHETATGYAETEPDDICCHVLDYNPIVAASPALMGSEGWRVATFMGEYINPLKPVR